MTGSRAAAWRGLLWEADAEIATGMSGGDAAPGVDHLRVQIYIIVT